MGTVLQVEVVAGDRQAAELLCRRAVETARSYDDLLTTWRTDGELARLNEQAGHGPVAISLELHDALLRMLAFTEATDGAFDPSVGRAVEFWRQQKGIAESSAVAPAPAGSSDRVALGTNRSETDGLRHWAALGEGVRLDAGGIGKGMALDAITELLRSGGAKAAFLDFGGSSQSAFGSPEKGGRWTVALPSLTGVVGTAVLADRALSTSIASVAGATAGPIIDPRSMRPVPVPRLATVVAADATTAEVWSTALMVLGRKGLDKAAAAGLQAMFEDGEGRTNVGPSGSSGAAGLEERSLDGAEQHH